MALQSIYFVIAATTLGPLRGAVEMRQTGALPPWKTPRVRTSPQKLTELSRSSWWISPKDLSASTKRPLRYSIDFGTFSIRNAVTERPCERSPACCSAVANELWMCAAAETSNGVIMAAHMASTANSSGRPNRIMVAVDSGIGSTLNVTSLTTANVPQLLARPRQTSTPVTFFITRPPDLINSPRPVTARTPMKWSRAAPAVTRRGPEVLVANTPPMVDNPGWPPVKLA